MDAVFAESVFFGEFFFWFACLALGVVFSGDSVGFCNGFLVEAHVNV